MEFEAHGVHLFLPGAGPVRKQRFAYGFLDCMENVQLWWTRLNNHFTILAANSIISKGKPVSF